MVNKARWDMLILKIPASVIFSNWQAAFCYEKGFRTKPASHFKSATEGSGYFLFRQ